MSTPALIMMLSANGIVIAVTAYFFYKVLTTAPPDAVDEDDANFPRGG
ncbi:MAG: hypothetical protein KF734_10775 [Saprospiraceae bacterium]|nr:hypothetical protein [Saprospiraceae bacterium]